MSEIKLKGGNKHNLKNISVNIPKNCIVMATGVSGSGKSSLMFDLIFEEGKRMYLESIGILNGLVSEINYEEMTGISPTISVKQNLVKQNNPRSTVASKTEILKLLSTLFSNYGVSYDERGNEIYGRNNPFPLALFSYNNPQGMCKNCYGLGKKYKVFLNELMISENDTLNDILKRLKLGKGTYNLFKRNFKNVMEEPLSLISTEVKNDIMYGHFVQNNSEKQSICLERILDNKRKKGENVEKYYTLNICPDCDGERLNENGRNITINNKSISDLCKMSIEGLYDFLQPLKENTKSIPYINNMVTKICLKLKSLVDFNLGYLSLYRDVKTLSGGEIQRLFLSDHLNSRLNSVIYVLDEPTVGLHSSEKEPIIDAIKILKNQGNSVLIVDHDKMLIQEADFIMDVGPKAGIQGGEIIHAGDYESLLENNLSITGAYLSKRKEVYNRNFKDVNVNETQFLNLDRLSNNNVKNVSLSIPLNHLVAMAGVSGSGKTSLINAITTKLKYFSDNGNLKDIDKYNHISNYIKVAQEPIGRSINSIPATFLNVWDEIRSLFSRVSPDMIASDFSFNSKGACEQCKGKGQKSIEFSDGTKIFHKCPSCKGKRYKKEVLSTYYKNKNISDVLNMQISEALEFFEGNEGICRKLLTVNNIGMGYIKLGQPTSTLSGGEAQRLKLSKELSRSRKGNTLYILDEPTAGLSYFDISQLLKILDGLIEKGNSVVIVDHNNEVLKRCDFIFELGPGGGENGGNIINQGSPYSIKRSSKSTVGKYL